MLKCHSLLPVMFLLYLLQYLDKTSLGYTAIMGIFEDAVSSRPRSRHSLI